MKDTKETATNQNIEDRIAGSFERVATTAERVGIPVATFAIGAVAIGIASQAHLEILTWLGTALILASLGTYVWLTSRSTIRVQLPPPPIPTELEEQLRWLREQVEQHNSWMRGVLERQIERKQDE